MNFSQQLYHVSLIGRPNVGKSMLFNVLTHSRSALVHPTAGVTRDRKSGRCTLELSALPISIHDLGGLTDAMFSSKASEKSDPFATISQQMIEQAVEAVKHSDLVFFVVDARDGLCASDEKILEWLRKIFSSQKIFLVVNKAEFMKDEVEILSSFYELGLSQAHLVSAAHRQGLEELMEQAEHHLRASALKTGQISTQLEAQSALQGGEASEIDQEDGAPRVVFIGRPNAGKSTLTNAFLKSPRMITSSVAGTTREAIASICSYDGQNCLLVDTAGIRKKSTITEKLEYLGVHKAFAEIESASVVVLVLEAQKAGDRQDLTLVRKCLELGKPLVLALNKSDQCSAAELKMFRTRLLEEVRFAPYLPVVEVSAKYGKGLKSLFDKIFFTAGEAKKSYATAQLNRLLQTFLLDNPPPLCKRTGTRIRIKYIHQQGVLPLRFVLKGNQLQALPDSYKKFLEKRFREALKLRYVPILMEFENQANPFSPHASESRIHS